MADGIHGPLTKIDLRDATIKVTATVQHTATSERQEVELRLEDLIELLRQELIPPQFRKPGPLVLEGEAAERAAEILRRRGQAT